MKNIYPHADAHQRPQNRWLSVHVVFEGKSKTSHAIQSHENRMTSKYTIDGLDKKMYIERFSAINDFKKLGA